MDFPLGKTHDLRLFGRIHGPSVEVNSQGQNEVSVIKAYKLQIRLENRFLSINTKKKDKVPWQILFIGNDHSNQCLLPLELLHLGTRSKDIFARFGRS